MDSITSLIGARIRAQRLRLRLTQEELAERAGLMGAYIGQIERGEKNLTLVSLQKIVSALGITFSELFECIEEDSDSSSIAAQCYELVNGMRRRDQERVYRILCEIEQLMK